MKLSICLLIEHIDLCCVIAWEMFVALIAQIIVT